jgi:hypothetical protein
MIVNRKYNLIDNFHDSLSEGNWFLIENYKERINSLATSISFRKLENDKQKQTFLDRNALQVETNIGQRKFLPEK